MLWHSIHTLSCTTPAGRGPRGGRGVARRADWGWITSPTHILSFSFWRSEWWTFRQLTHPATITGNIFLILTHTHTYTHTLTHTNTHKYKHAHMNLYVVKLLYAQLSFIVNMCTWLYVCLSVCVCVRVCVCLFDPLQGRAALMSIVAVPAGFTEDRPSSLLRQLFPTHKQTHTHTHRHTQIVREISSHNVCSEK